MSGKNHMDFVAALCDQIFILSQRILSVQLQMVWVNFCTYTLVTILRFLFE